MPSVPVRVSPASVPSIVAAFFLHVARAGSLGHGGGLGGAVVDGVRILDFALDLGLVGDQPAFLGGTSIVTVADAPLASVPSSQLTFLPLISQLPVEGSAEAGST